MHPCGTICGSIRRGYTTYAILYQGGPPVKIRWFFADPGAALCPQPHWYGPKIWDDPKSQWTPPVGDVRGRAPTWADAGNTLGYAGLEACGSAAAWAGAGLPGADFPLMITDARGVLPCCTLADIVPEGGFGLGGSALWGQGIVGQLLGKGLTVSNVILPIQVTGVLIGKGLSASIVTLTPTTIMGYTAYFNWRGNPTTTTKQGRLLVGASVQTGMLAGFFPVKLQLSDVDSFNANMSAVLDGIQVGDYLKIWSTTQANAYAFYQVIANNHVLTTPNYHEFTLKYPGNGLNTVVALGAVFGVSPYTPGQAVNAGYTIVSAFDTSLLPGEFTLTDGSGFPITSLAWSSGTAFLTIHCTDQNGLDITSVLASITTANFVKIALPGYFRSYGFAQIVLSTFNPGDPSYTFSLTLLSGTGPSIGTFPINGVISFL